MRYRAVGSNWLESLALRFGAVPIPLVDAIVPLVQTRSIMAAVELGVFEALRDGARTAAEVARERNLEVGSTELLLRVLCFAGYAAFDGERFTLSKLARDTLIEGAPHEMRGYLLWNFTQWNFLEGLEALVRTGRGVDIHSSMTDERAWGHYQLAMLELARRDAPFLAKHVPVKRGAMRLLDLAGSHGLIGATICRAHAPMTSLVIDLAAAIPHAIELARRAGLADVVEHRAGDIAEADYGGPHDVVLLANILHHFLPDANQALLRRAHAALSDEGTVAIWAAESPRRESKPDIGDTAALYFHLTSSARSFHGDDYAAWAREAGFTDVRAIRPRFSPGQVLVVGRKR